MPPLSEDRVKAFATALWPVPVGIRREVFNPLAREFGLSIEVKEDVLYQRKHRTR